MWGTRERKSCASRGESIEAGVAASVARLSAKVLGAESSYLVDTEIADFLHQRTNRRTFDRKLVGQLIDALGQRVHEEAWPEHRRAEQQPLAIGPAILARKGVEELRQDAGAVIPWSDTSAFAEPAQKIRSAEGAVGAGQPVSAGESAGAQHLIEHLRGIRRRGVLVRRVRSRFRGIRPVLL